MACARFHGLLVVIRLDPTYNGQPVYALAHLSEVLVEVGQRVEPDQLIGRSGHVRGGVEAHFHLEVRVGGRLCRHAIRSSG
jgi:murein DD-endopeptidase MepM/ murein hydrolase activator NlpD